MRLGVFAWGERAISRKKYPNSGGNPQNVNPDGFVAVSVGEPINTNQIKFDIFPYLASILSALYILIFKLKLLFTFVIEVTRLSPFLAVPPKMVKRQIE